MALPEITLEQARIIHDHNVVLKGWRVGLRHALGLVLEERGLELSKEQQERVNSCYCGMQVRQWIRRAVIASSTDELFDDADDE